MITGTTTLCSHTPAPPVDLRSPAQPHPVVTPYPTTPSLPHTRQPPNPAPQSQHGKLAPQPGETHQGHRSRPCEGRTVCAGGVGRRRQPHHLRPTVMASTERAPNVLGVEHSRGEPPVPAQGEALSTVCGCFLNLRRALAPGSARFVPTRTDMAAKSRNLLYVRNSNGGTQHRAGTQHHSTRCTLTGAIAAGGSLRAIGRSHRPAQRP